MPVQDPVDEILSGLKDRAVELAPFPAVAAAVLRTADDPNGSAGKLSQLIQSDPALALIVMRVANSAGLGAQCKATSLPQATVRLGVRQVSDIAVAACVRSSLAGARSKRVREVWAHAAATATYARMICVLRRHHVGSAFLCGLLHSVGKLVLLKSFPKMPDSQLSRHSLIGVAVAQSWHLPPAVIESIEHWDNPKEATTFPQEAATTHLAQRLALTLIFPNAPEPEPTTLEDALDVLNLYPDELQSLRDQGDKVRSTVAALR